MRNIDITCAKAVGIMLMVLCHAFFVDLYHIQSVVVMMPLFFFFSGFCLKAKYFEEPHLFAWKRVKGIYWPYLKWSIIFLLLHNVFFALNIYNGQYGYNYIGQHVYSLGEMLYRLKIIIFLMDQHDELLGGYWFMRALLRGSLIAFMLLWVLNIVSKKIKTRYACNLLVGGGCFDDTLFSAQSSASHVDIALF